MLPQNVNVVAGNKISSCIMVALKNGTVTRFALSAVAMMNMGHSTLSERGT